MIGTLERWLDRLTPVLAGLAGLATFAYLGRELHFALFDLAKFALIATLLVLPLGWIILRPIRLPANPPLARLGLALLVGYPASVTIYYLLGLLHLQDFYPIVVGLTVAASIPIGLRGLRQRYAQAGSFSALAEAARRKLDFGLIIIYLVALCVCAPWFRYLEPSDDGFIFRGHPENLIHAAYVQEAYRGVPPEQFPMAAGQPSPKFHVFHQVLVMMAARYSGLDPLQSFFTFAPIVLHGLLVLCIGLILQSIVQQPAIRWLAAGSIYTFGLLVELFLGRAFAFGAPSVAYFFPSGPSLGGLVVTATILACLTLFQRSAVEGIPAQNSAGLLYLAAFAAATLYLFKAEFFVLVFPALTLGLFLVWLRDRQRLLVTSGGVALFSLAFFSLSWRAPSWAQPVFQWGVFAQARLIETQRLLDAQRYLYGALKQYLAADNPAWPVLILLTVLIGWRMTQLSPIIPAYIYNRSKAFSRLALWEVVVILLYPLALAVAFTLDARGLTSPPTGLLSTVIFILLAFVSQVLNSSLVGNFVVQRLGSRWKQKYVSACALGFILVTAPVAARFVRSQTANAELRLTNSEMAALQYLAHETPVEAVVVQNMYENPVVSAFSGRRVVIERFDEHFPDREKDVNDLYTTRDTAQALSLLRRYGVAYLIEQDEAPVRFDKSILQLAFDGGEVKVYRVQQP